MSFIATQLAEAAKLDIYGGNRLIILAGYPIPNTQEYYLTKDANVIAYKSDAGISLTQQGERNLDIIQLDFILNGPYRVAEKLFLEQIYEKGISVPFISEMTVLQSAIIEQMIIHKNKQRRDLFYVTIRLKETRSTTWEIVGKLVDAIGYSLGSPLSKELGNAYNVVTSKIPNPSSIAGSIGSFNPLGA